LIELKELKHSNTISLLVHHEIPLKLAKTIYETITGGLLSLLLKFIEEYHQGKSYETILKECDDKLEPSLKVMEISPNQEVFRKISLHTRLCHSMVVDFLAERDVFKSLLQRQVLALHADDYCSFANNHVENWMRSKQQVECETISRDKC
jgi:hypothetical protein